MNCRNPPLKGGTTYPLQNVNTVQRQRPIHLIAKVTDPAFGATPASLIWDAQSGSLCGPRPTDDAASGHAGRGLASNDGTW